MTKQIATAPISFRLTGQELYSKRKTRKITKTKFPSKVMQFRLKMIDSGISVSAVQGIGNWKIRSEIVINSQLLVGLGPTDSWSEQTKHHFQSGSSVSLEFVIKWLNRSDYCCFPYMRSFGWAYCSLVTFWCMQNENLIK